MKFFHKNATMVFVALFVALGLTGPIAAHAATSPSLGTAASYSILSGSEVTNTGATTVSGDVGISPGIGAAPHFSGFGTVTLGGTMHDADAAALAAQGDKNTAYGALAAQGCDTTYVGAFKDLAGENLVPGVYCADQFRLTGTLTLNGGATDVWVFKSSADLLISGGAAANVVFTGGGQPCNVWWRVVSTATFDAGSSLVGNILADTSITMASGATLNGRALARTAEVTMVGNTISGPTCAAAAVNVSPSSSGRREGTINVVKTVINDNGRTKTVVDFPLFIDGVAVVSGETNAFRALGDAYAVTETVDPNYTRTFSGDCDSNGNISLQPGAQAFCIVTNDDIGAPVVIPPVPPLIDVVKVPNPLTLPNGPGSVEYTYTVRNIGTVPMTNVTLVGDTCSPILLVSGDANADNKLDMNEAWVHRCSTTLSETHTNTVVATGWANGLSATDIANATVVVGMPLPPPLIHVTKVPNPFTLLAGGGMVTYTKKVTNPGTVALSNVRLTDDVCNPVSYVSGDTNGDSKLDTTETWTYICRTNVSKTTVNTVTASGDANGLTARDFAVATVVVAAAAPTLPNTGFSMEERNILLGSMLLMGALAGVSISLAVARRKRTM